MTDDAAFTVGSTLITPVGGTYRSSRDSVDANDGGAFAMTASRALLTSIETPAGDSAMDDANDAIRVNIVAGAAAGGTSITDDSAFTVGASALTPAGGIYRSTRDSVDDNDVGALAMTAKRGLYVTVETPAGDSAMDDTNDAIKVNVVAGGGTGGTAVTDDTAFTPGSTSYTPAGGTYRSVRDAVDDNDGGAFAMTAKRGQYVVVETPTGDSAMDDTNDAVRVNIVAGASSGGTAMTDDAAFTVASTSFTPTGGTYRSVRDAVDDNDGGLS